MFDDHYVVSRSLRLTSMLVRYAEIQGVFDRYARRIDQDTSKDLERKTQPYFLPNGKRVVTATLSVIQRGDYGMQGAMEGDTLVQFEVIHHQKMRESWSDLLATLGVPRYMSFFVPSEIEGVCLALRKLGAVWLWEKCYAAPLTRSERESLDRRLQQLEWSTEKLSQKELDARLKSAVIEGLRPEEGGLSKASLVYPREDPSSFLEKRVQ